MRLLILFLLFPVLINSLNVNRFNDPNEVRSIAGLQEGMKMRKLPGISIIFLI
jgi:hypothetical protein